MTWSKLKTGLKQFVPAGVRQLWRRQRIEAMRRQNRGRSVAQIFSAIYEDNRWGGEHGNFNSGSGSSDSHADEYGRLVRNFVAQHKVQSVVDLGCGDFRVGARIVSAAVNYTGIDVVPSLIAANRKQFGGPRIQFECLDIIEDPLPQGDLCLIRQVLQHLSNEQIATVLRKAERYRHVIVTEHYPAAEALRQKNLDKACGEDVRIYDGSAVFLDAPPFNRAVSAPLLDVDAGQYLMRPGERIRSFLLTHH
jgi:SAM-dependent methyltransferase